MHSFLAWLPAGWPTWLVFVLVCALGVLLGCGLWGLWWCAREAVYLVLDWRAKRREQGGNAGMAEYDAPDHRDPGWPVNGVLDEDERDDAWADELHHMNHDLAQPEPGAWTPAWHFEQWEDFAAWELDQIAWRAAWDAEADRLENVLKAGEYADPWWIKQPA